jgi:hypothetical protein
LLTKKKKGGSILLGRGIEINLKGNSSFPSYSGFALEPISTSYINEKKVLGSQQIKYPSNAGLWAMPLNLSFCFPLGKMDEFSLLN